MKRTTLLFFLLALAALPMRATNVQGAITSNTTWTLAGSPYILTGNVNVGGTNSPVLTIEAGVVVRTPLNTELTVNVSGKGGILVNGTAAAPVLFTSTTGTTPGSWFGLRIGATAGAPASRISHAIVEYGGWEGGRRGGITLEGTATQIDHVTLRRNQYAGLYSLISATPAISDSVIRDNVGPGILAVDNTTLSMVAVDFQGNSDYAVLLSPKVRLLLTRALTASGNLAGGDGIAIFSGTIETNATWPLSAIPYILSDTLYVHGATSPILTIAGGNIIRGNAGFQLFVNHSGKGAIQANGTADAPILFTSNVSATPGAWNGIWLGSIADGPQTNLTYTTIEHAGSTFFGRGGITIHGNTPTFDHVILRNNLYAGVLVTAGVPRITNSQFIANTTGIRAGNNVQVQATLNWWSSADGPCLTNCTAGQQFVSPSVAYEPWLIAEPAGPFFLASATHRNPVFNPAIRTTTWIDATTSATGSTTMTVRNQAGTLLRTIAVAGSPATLRWDGADEAGVSQPNGTYSYELAATAPSQPAATIARGVAVIDRARALTLTNPVASNPFFSPNGDTIKETTRITSATNYEDTTWTVTVLDPTSNVVRTLNGSGPTIAFDWDGRDAAAALQRDNPYTVRVDASVGIPRTAGATLTKNVIATLDTTLPVSAIATPLANAVLSNIYANGATRFTPTGTSTDTNLQDWRLEVGVGAAPVQWFNLSTGNAAVTSGPLMTTGWETVNASGVHTLRLSTTDKAGNGSSATRPISIGHFKASQSAYQFNAVANGTLNYVSTIPFPVTESIVIRNLAGTVVRNLVTNVARNAGTFTDTFNGRDDFGALLPDGPYFYVATLSADGFTFDWDQSNVMRNEALGFNDSLGIQPYDPFNNKPLTFSYNFPTPGRVSVATTTTPGSVVGECATPTANFFCPAAEVWQESGPQTFTWWGIDHTGSYRTIRSVAVVTWSTNFPKNAAVLFGSKPKVQNVKVFPPVFGPEVGEQSVEFDLTSLESKPVSVTVDFIGLESKTIMRTIGARSQEVGHVVLRWDGRTQQGDLVAPGRYNVVVTATDKLGNVVRSGILTEIQY